MSPIQQALIDAMGWAFVVAMLTLVALLFLVGG